MNSEERRGREKSKTRWLDAIENGLRRAADVEDAEVYNNTTRVADPKNSRGRRRRGKKEETRSKFENLLRGRLS